MKNEIIKQKTTKKFKKFLFFLLPFLIFPNITISQQLTKSQVSKSPSIELDAVQTPNGTFITTVMIMDKDLYDYMIRVYRSTNSGKSWDSVFSVNSDSNYSVNADPFMTIDNEGNIYFIIMRIQKYGVEHLWIYKSTDDGKNWNVAGKPVSGNNYADYEQIITGNQGKIFVSYTEYLLTPFSINFTKSTDYGKTWSASKIIKPDITGYSSVGADMEWLSGNKIAVAFGDYIANTTYLTTSDDYGDTWEPCILLPTISYSVNKIISNKKFEYFGVITHNPHRQNSIVYFNYTIDNKNWINKIIDSSAAYCEGLIDNNGNYHLVYNDYQNGTFNLSYIYSTDQGKSFSNPIKLISTSYNAVQNISEYQSLILGKDNQLYITYIDWSDLSKVCQIVFPPMLINSVEPENNNSIMIFPNPANDYFALKNINSDQSFKIEIYNFNGQLILESSYNSNNNRINVDNLLAGTYLVLIKSQNQIYIEKLIKI